MKGLLSLVMSLKLDLKDQRLPVCQQTFQRLVERNGVHHVKFTKITLKCNPWSGIPHLGRGVSAYSSRISHTLGRLSWEVNLRLLLKNPLNSRTIMMIFYLTAMGELSRHCVFPAVHCFTRISFQKILLAIGNRIVEKPPQPSFHHMSHPGRPHCW